MKAPTSILRAVSLLIFCAATFQAQANNDGTQSQEIAASNTSHQLCVVEGSKEARSKLYNNSPEAQEIMELERQACWMLARKEVQKLSDDIIDKNGLLFLDGGNILYGNEQQRAMFNEFLNIKGLFFTYEPVEAHVSKSKDMAWAFGLYKIKMPSQAVETGKYVSVWKKNNGRWKNVAEMRNPFKR